MSGSGWNPFQSGNRSRPPPPPPIQNLTISKQPIQQPNRPAVVSNQPQTRPHFYDADVLPPEIIPLDPTRPLSPFARKHGVSPYPYHRLNRSDGQAHSGLRPEYPGTVPLDVPDSLPKPDPDTLDRIFRSEREQVVSRNPTIKSWRIPSLNSRLAGGWPSEEELLKSTWDQWETFKTRLCVVDESRWFSCFRKDHWYDSRHNVLNTLSDPIPGVNMWPNETWYTVDNPVIWELDALLFTNPIPIGHLSTHDFPDHVRPFKSKLVPRPKESRASSGELLEMLEGLTKDNLIHSFCDETTLANDAHAITTRQPNQNFFRATILYHASSTIRPLLEMETTVPERCMQLLEFVHLILHELMHAIWKCSFDMGDNLLDEPFYDDEWIAELGHSFTQQLWGGSLQPCPNRLYVQRRFRGFTTFFDMTTFPCLGYAADKTTFDNNAAQLYRDGKKISFHLSVPAAWASAIISEKFWAKIIPQRGSLALKAPVIFASPVVGGTCYETHTLRTYTFWVPELKSDYESAMKRWTDAGAHIAHVRAPWYKTAYEEWKSLPWGSMPLVQLVEKFRYHHANRNLAVCRELSGAALRQTRPSDGARLNNNMALPYLTSLLMLLSLPINPVGNFIKPRVPRQRSYYPSRAAEPRFKALGIGDRLGPYHVLNTVAKEFVITYRGFENYDDMIKNFHHAFEFSEYEIGAPLGWLVGIIDCFIQLRAERSSHPNPNSWGPFSFKVPPFEPGWVTAQSYQQSFTIPIQQRFKAVVPWTGGNFPPPPRSPRSPVNLTINFNNHRIHPLGYAAQHSHFKRNYPKHFYIGDVANHRALNDAWVVEVDGEGGFDVFDITGELTLTSPLAFYCVR
ncbi:hypothetical protein K445DRAFT_371397 [Daldinia sp. EC12]|nr:hypothetical protein K445DRAFT_371397 [Daldinia sp. EC12]